jgi:hypothetical protein
MGSDTRSGNSSSATSAGPLRGSGSGLGRPPAATAGLTATQLQILAGLAKQPDLTPNEALRQARTFVTLGRLANAPTMKGEWRPASLPPDPTLTADQVRIRDHLWNNPHLPESEVARQFLAFAKAGRPPAKAPERP